MAAKDVSQEYIVKLGTMIDNEGVQRILSFFDTSKMKAIGLSAAIAGATAAVYKFIESATANEFELAKLAKQKKKTLELTRAENNAMKAMGKTMAEINKDKNLKEIYKDLVAFNKEMKMPDVREALDKVRNLEISFTKLKSTINTAMQWINAQVLINLERPIDRITDKIDSFTGRLKDDMKNYAPKIATVLSDFAEGILGIVEGGVALVGMLDKLPSAIKEVGIAVIWLIALIKGGTIVRLLALVTLIGDIMHDYDNYQWNKTHPNDQVPVALGDDVWSVLEDQSLNPGEKAAKIASNLVRGITDLLNEGFKDFDMTEIFGDGTEEGGGLISGIIKWFKTNNQNLSELGDAVIGFITRGVRTVGGTTGGIISKILDGLFGDEKNVTPEEVYKDVDGSKATVIAGGIGGYFAGVIEDISKNGFGPGTLKAGLGEGLLGAVLSSVMANVKKDEKTGKYEIKWGDVFGDLSTFGEMVIGIIAESITAVQDTGEIIFNSIADSLLKGGSGTPGKGNSFDALAKAFTVLGQDKGLGDALSTGIATWFATGSVLGGIVGGIAQAIAFVMENPTENGPELVKQIQELGKSLLFFLFGGTDEETGVQFEGILQGLGNALSSLWEEIGPKLEPLKESLIEFFNGIWQTITNKLGEMLQQVLISFYNSAGEGSLIDQLIDDPNRSKVRKGKNGEFYISSTNGQELRSTEDVISRIGGILPYLKFENGSFKFTGAAEGWGDASVVGTGTNNNGLFVRAYNAALKGDYTALDNIISDMKGKGYYSGTGAKDARTAMYGEEAGTVYKHGSMYYRLNEDGTGQRWAKGKGEWVDATEAELKNVKESANTLAVSGLDPLSLSSENASKTIGTLDEKLSGMNGNVEDLSATISSAVTAINEAIEGLSGGEGKAWGGRIGSAGHYLVGEDGPEYIVPITKPERAMSLINQALSEMGMGALGNISKDFGVGGTASTGTLGASLESVVGGLGGNTTVSAPVNIYVTATGADGKDIGTAVYDAAERHLLKTLRGVYA